MNAYMNKEHDFNSNKRINKLLFGEEAYAQSRGKKQLEKLLQILISLVRALTSDKALRIFRPTSLVGCLLGFVGIIAAMESNAISLGIGFLLGMALVGIEYLCLRPHRAQS